VVYSDGVFVDRFESSAAYVIYEHVYSPKTEREEETQRKCKKSKTQQLKNQDTIVMFI